MSNVGNGGCYLVEISRSFGMVSVVLYVFGYFGDVDEMVMGSLGALGGGGGGGGDCQAGLLMGCKCEVGHAKPIQTAAAFLTAFIQPWPA